MRSDGAHSGRGASPIIENNNFDAVLLDISMPEFSGLDVIDALNKSGKIKENKIIILTASVQDDEDLSHLKTKGVHTILKKPVEIDVLRSTLENLS